MAVSLNSEGAGEGRLRLLCTVTDTGIGIAEGNQEVIFQSFEQVDPNKHSEYGGSGLGLAICRHYLEMMDGTIRCTSREGQGSTFFLTAVFKLCSEDRLETGLDESPQGSQRSLKILVAEDSLMNQIFTQEILKERGHEVVIVADGQQAIEALAGENYDLVFMDIRMPNMDGEEALRIIRQGRYTGINPHIPVIALTAYALKDDQERLIKQGFDGYLAKPIDIQALEKIIARLETLKGSDGGAFSED